MIIKHTNLSISKFMHTHMKEFLTMKVLELRKVMMQQDIQEVCVCDSVSSPDHLHYLWVRTSCDSSAFSSICSVHTYTHTHTSVSLLLEMDQLLPSLLLCQLLFSKHLSFCLHNRKCVAPVPKSWFFSRALLDETKISLPCFKNHFLNQHFCLIFQ